jgi:hypothetical protein
MASDIVAFDADAGCARSLSRYYLLGNRIGDAGRRQ